MRAQRRQLKNGVLLQGLEILKNIFYYQFMKETTVINIDQYHDVIRNKHMLCHEHSPPM